MFILILILHYRLLIVLKIYIKFYGAGLPQNTIRLKKSTQHRNLTPKHRKHIIKTQIINLTIKIGLIYGLLLIRQSLGQN